MIVGVLGDLVDDGDDDQRPDGVGGQELIDGRVLGRPVRGRVELGAVLVGAQLVAGRLEAIRVVRVRLPGIRMDRGAKLGRAKILPTPGSTA